MKFSIHDNINTRLVLSILISFIVNLILILSFSLLADSVLDGNLITFDTLILKNLESLRSPIRTAIMLEITKFGYQYLIFLQLILTGLLIFKNKTKLALELGLIVIVGGCLNLILKSLYGVQRPTISPIYTPIYTEILYAFPSGHAMVAVTFYGLLMYLVYKSNWPWVYKIGFILVLFCLVLLIGLSRVYLGVHYPSDIIGGYLGGLLWLVAIYFVYKSKALVAGLKA
jgi:undecaprenyl-diphosphatase